MAYKKLGASALSLLLVVSIVAGFVPQARADDSNSPEPPEPPTIDLYSVPNATIVKEFVANKNNRVGFDIYGNDNINNGKTVEVVSGTAQTGTASSVSENLYSGSAYNNGSCETNFHIQSPNPYLAVMPSVCGTPTAGDDTTPTAQNVSIVTNSTINPDTGDTVTSTVAVQTFGARHGYPVLFDYARTTSVRQNPQIDPSIPPTVQVNVGTSGRAESFDVMYQRTGTILDIVDGDKTASFTEGSVCQEFTEGNLTCADTAIYYKNSNKTYFIYFPQSWSYVNASVKLAETIGSCAAGQTSQASNPCIESTNESAQPRLLNSDIVFMSTPDCRTYNSDGQADCTASALSADGRVGYAVARRGGQGGGFNFLGLVVSAIFSFVIGPELLFYGIVAEGPIYYTSVFLLEGGGTVIGAASTIYQLATLSDPVIQVAATSGGIGYTVENSGTMPSPFSGGYGDQTWTWTWSGGFTAPTACRADQIGTYPNCTCEAPKTEVNGVCTSPAATCSYDASLPGNELTWKDSVSNTGDCYNRTVKYNNISSDASVEVPSESPTYFGSVSFRCNAGAWEYVGGATCRADAPQAWLEIY